MNKNKNAKPDLGLLLFLGILLGFFLVIVAVNRSQPRQQVVELTPTTASIEAVGQGAASMEPDPAGAADPPPPHAQPGDTSAPASPAPPPAVKEEQIAPSRTELDQAAESDRITQQEANGEVQAPAEQEARHENENTLDY